ncbi:NIPSNAP family protein [Marininema halotolerans]|uniref:NIPSNAP protein n=1 Tax=Marininema halotolerans TaxID=1155944 RepID=A0A1I6NQG7_9BACL|nr:NIPSNAP family protein [Marininema halotolerans]SFS30125.1 NIPSNAP protein [Marininema halotolerans]
MIFRKRVYRIQGREAENFQRFFNQYVYPIQAKYGAKLTGYWLDESEKEVTAIWQYASLSHYKEIERHVSADPLTKRAKEEGIRQGLDLDDLSIEEEFIAQHHHEEAQSEV